MEQNDNSNDTVEESKSDSFMDDNDTDDITVLEEEPTCICSSGSSKAYECMQNPMNIFCNSRPLVLHDIAVECNMLPKLESLKEYPNDEKGDGDKYQELENKKTKFFSTLPIPSSSQTPRTRTVLVYGLFDTVTSFFTRLIWRTPVKRGKRKVRFHIPGDNANEDEEEFNYRLTPIVSTTMIHYCLVIVENKFYPGTCCNKIRKKSSFKQELESTKNKRFMAKQKELTETKDVLFDFIRYLYWGPIWNIRKTIDFKQDDRVEDEISPIATKIWLFAFIVDEIFQKKDLKKSSQRWKLEKIWETFMKTRESIWIQIQKTYECFFLFKKFVFFVYKILRPIGKSYGLKIRLDYKNLFKYSHMEGLQLQKGSKKELETGGPLILQFEEKQSLNWFDFFDTPPSEQEKFLYELLDEAKTNVLHVIVQVEFLFRDILFEKLDKNDKFTFSERMYKAQDLLHFFLNSPNTSVAEYDRLQNLVRDFSSEIFEVFNSLKYILRRVMEVCDITELVSIYLSSKYKCCKMTHKVTKHWCHSRGKKLYPYSATDFMRTYYEQALLINTILYTKHCNLGFRHYSPNTPSRQSSKSRDIIGISRSKDIEESRSKVIGEDGENVANAVSATSSVAVTDGNLAPEPVPAPVPVPISIFNYLESEEFQLRAILRRDTYVGKVLRPKT